MRTVATQTQQSLSGLKGQQGLLLDESGWEKAGTKSVGVARQYIGQVGKVCNAQVGVFAALVRGERVGIVNARLLCTGAGPTTSPGAKQQVFLLPIRCIKPKANWPSRCSPN